MSLFDLTGKVAIVTGSSRGIGRAIALRMAEQGARVVIASRKQDACQAVADEITSVHGDGRAIAVAAGISSKEALRHLVSETNTRLGAVDILVCNAASNPYYGPLGSISDEQFRKVLDNNILSNHWLVQLTAPQMIERTDGAVFENLTFADRQYFSLNRLFSRRIRDHDAARRSTFFFQTFDDDAVMKRTDLHGYRSLGSYLTE